MIRQILIVRFSHRYNVTKVSCSESQRSQEASSRYIVDKEISSRCRRISRRIRTENAFYSLKFKIGEFRRSDSVLCVHSAFRTRRNFQRKWERRRKTKERRETLRQAPGRPATSKRSRYFPSELLSARRAPSNNSAGEKPARINGNFPFKMRNSRAERRRSI